MTSLKTGKKAIIYKEHKPGTAPGFAKATAAMSLLRAGLSCLFSTFGFFDAPVPMFGFNEPSMKNPSFIVLALKAMLYQLWARIAAITKKRRISVIYMKKSQLYLPPPSSLEWPGITDARANRAQGVPRYDACWRPALSWSEEQDLRSVGMGTIVFPRISAQALVKNFG